MMAVFLEGKNEKILNYPTFLLLSKFAFDCFSPVHFFSFFRIFFPQSIKMT